jgi:hypothetical protein
MLRVCLSTLLVIAGAIAAHAETTIVLKPNDRPMTPVVEQIQVQVSVNMFVPLAGGGGQATKAQEDGRRMVYDLAEHECAVLREALASECHLETINVNVTHNQNMSQQPDGLSVNGNVGFRIVPK